ncbi:hypothetical protein D3C87_77010 [compost metagenome]
MKKSEISYKITGNHINGMVYKSHSNDEILFRTLKEGLQKEDNCLLNPRSDLFCVGENLYTSIDYYNEQLIIKEDVVLSYDQFKALMEEMKQIEEAFELLKVAEELTKEK